MDDRTAAFTVSFPEGRKTRTARTLASVSFFVFWILWGFDLFGPPGVTDLPWFAVAAIPFALFLGFSVYGSRKHKELVPIINRRFAEEFAAHTQDAYPQNVDVLKVKRSIAVKRADGSVFVWGVERNRDIFTVFPMT